MVKSGSYRKYINDWQTFSEIMHTLAALPSPRKEFFDSLVRILNVTPAYMRMVLCSTRSGKRLSKARMELVAKHLNSSVDVLFPDDTAAYGSLISMYRNLPAIPAAYEEFISDIQTVTGASRTSILKWGAEKHHPRPSRQKLIALLLDSDSFILFYGFNI